MSIPKIWRKIPEQYNLIGRRCSKCNELFFPPREVCLKCGSHEMYDYKFKDKGSIVTYTIIRTPVSDPEGEIIEKPARNIPYILAIIKLEEGPMVTTEIVDCSLDEVEINKQVEMVFRKIQEKGNKGVIQYGYKFKIVWTRQRTKT